MEANRGKILQDQQARYPRNKEKLSIKRRAYFLANRDAINDRMRAYRAKLKESGLVGPDTASSGQPPGDRPAAPSCPEA